LGAAELTANQARSRKPAWKRVLPFLSFGLAMFCLVWVIQAIDLGQLWSQIRRLKVGWLTLAVICDLLAYLAQGLRWRLLITPVGDLPILSATRALFAGLFVNEILPLRPGEVLRAWLAAREMGRSPVQIVPSVVVERLIDGVWLAVGLLLLAHFVPLPARLSSAVRVFVIVMVCLLAVATVLHRLLTRLRLERRWHVAQHLRFVPDNLPVAGAWVTSGAMIVLQALSFWFTMKACPIGLSLPEAFGVLLIVRIGTVIPGAPANLGTYQFAAVLGLMLFGVSREIAAPFSMILFTVLTAPLWLLGSIAMVQTGVGLSEIRRGRFDRRRPDYP
jgi:uncharacterized membrane protein YbhN (UPF0104 family)